MRKFIIKTGLKRLKKRRLFIISSGGGSIGGLYGLYIEIKPTQWHVLAHSFLPYPPRVSESLEKINSKNEQLTLNEISWLDYKFSKLFIDLWKLIDAQLSRLIRSPHYTIVNKLRIGKISLDENGQSKVWDIGIGDPQILASTIKVPVLTDIQRNQYIAGKVYGSLPTFPGFLHLSRSLQGIVVYVNIGIVSHITIVDPVKSELIFEADSGPGTCLIDAYLKEIPSNDKIDRDGAIASVGQVNSSLLDELAQYSWFKENGQKFADPDQFLPLLEQIRKSQLSNEDCIATITALTSRTIFECFKQNYTLSENPNCIILSGGGANNLTLEKFIDTYFGSIPVKRIDSFGIPLEMGLLAAIGLTMDHLCLQEESMQNGDDPKVDSIGKWILP